MTKTKNNQSNTNQQHRLPLYRRAWFLVLVVILLIAIIVCLILCFFKPEDDKNSNTQSVDDQTTQEDPDTTPVNINDGQHINEDEPYSDPDQITPQYEGENPNLANELSGSITYTNYNNGSFSVGTMINQSLSSGTCELQLINASGSTYTATSDIIFAGASTSSCYELKAVNVTPGHYEIKIILNSNGKQGIITEEIDL